MRSRVLIASLVISSVVAAGSCAAQNGGRVLAPDQMNLVRMTCESVMRIRNGVDMEACMRSLADTMAARSEGEIVWRADADCARQGLPRGTAAFSMCVLDRQRAYSANPQRVASATPPRLVYDPQRDGAEGYYNASFDTKRRREQYACAQLGITPASSAFGQCVADLDASLFNADHPNP